MPDRYKPASTVDSRAQLGEPLTEAELYIMRRLAAGAYDAEITRELSMSGRNFRRHMLAAQRKLGARTRPHAVALAAEQAARQNGRREGAPMAGGLTELRDRITEAATKWALTYPLSNWGFWGHVEGEAREHLAAVAKTLAATWGRGIADAVLTVAGPTDTPGDLP